MKLAVIICAVVTAIVVARLDVISAAPFTQLPSFEMGLNMEEIVGKINSGMDVTHEHFLTFLDDALLIMEENEEELNRTVFSTFVDKIKDEPEAAKIVNLFTDILTDIKTYFLVVRKNVQLSLEGKGDTESAVLKREGKYYQKIIIDLEKLMDLTDDARLTSLHEKMLECFALNYDQTTKKKWQN